MKDRFLFEDSFEQHLREKSDEFKMYPSDKIWSNIDNALHARRKKFIAFMTFLVAGILLVAGTEFFGPTRPVNASLRAKQPAPVQEAPPLDLSQFAAAPVPTGKSGPSSPESGSPLAQVRAPFVSSLPLEEPARENTTTALRGISLNPGVIGSNLPASLSNFRLPVAGAPNSGTSGDLADADAKTGAGANASADPKAHADAKAQADADLQTNVLKPSVVSANLSETGQTETNLNEISLASEKTGSKKLRNDRFSWQVYVTPTLLTRRLSGLEYQRLNPTISNGPITVVRYANVNGFVDNTPAMGYDIGGNLKYRLSKTVSLKAGLAFSYNRYFIQTYNSQPVYSTPSMNTYLGYVADSLTTPSPSNSFGAPKSQQQLQNQYFTLSVPVGIEWKVAGNGKVEFYLGASVQPGYLLNRNSYTISNDYSSYEKNPAVFNRWNLNTGAEAFISYRVGKVRWELGPQIRYQLFSTFKSGSPLRENMVIYGIRLGFSKSKW